jgi:hypothetical protein
MAQVVTLYIGNDTPSHISLPTTLAILGNYVPFTGADTAVDLGAQDFVTTGTLGAGAITGTSLTDGTAILDDGALSAITTIGMTGNLTIDSDTTGLILGADQDVTLYAAANGVLRIKGLSTAADPRITFESGNTGYIEWQEDELQFYISGAVIVESPGVFNAGGGIMLPAADPHIAGSWWDNAGTLTKSAG